MRRATLLLLLLALPLGCATPRSDVFRDETRDIRIDVLNLNFSDATLWALRGGERIRLGIVRGKQEESFELSWPVSLPLRVEMDFLAGPRCVTGQLSVDPGDVIYLELHEDPAREFICR
ncbi:MAG: hypothetical protein R3E10_08805 [Gemmatimonadota bacterium]